MTDIAIVIVGYDRPHSLSRLLESLSKVAFDGNRIPLIISLDQSGNDATEKVAEAFIWNHGVKTIRTYPQRLGLRKHIIECGDLTRDFEHLIVLEDDLYVSQNLFRFAIQAIEFYRDDARIAGIALYTHLWNVACDRPFQPLPDAFDVHFMQYACSWGQIWSREKWNRFLDWYRQHGDEFQRDPAVPPNLMQWSDHSWLKHHIRYCIEANKYFVYPRVSLTTNFSDKGQHNLGHENGFQVPMQEPAIKNYQFPTLDESRAVYDAFFEPMKLASTLGIDPVELCVDLYGLKRNNAKLRYWLTMECADHLVLKSFDLAFRPHESNILYQVPGVVIKLYDTATNTLSTSANCQDIQDFQVKYDVRCISYKSLLRYSLRILLRRLRVKLTGKESPR